MPVPDSSAMLGCSSRQNLPKSGILAKFEVVTGDFLYCPRKNVEKVAVGLRFAGKEKYVGEDGAKKSDGADQVNAVFRRLQQAKNTCYGGAGIGARRSKFSPKRSSVGAPSAVFVAKKRDLVGENA